MLRNPFKSLFHLHEIANINDNKQKDNLETGRDIKVHVTIDNMLLSFWCNDSVNGLSATPPSAWYLQRRCNASHYTGKTGGIQF